MKDSVLVVDDDRATCSLLELGLRGEGFDVRSTTSPVEALHTVTDEDISVVVTDLNMRELGGLELCERVVASRPDVPVIVVTAFGSLDNAIEAIRAGAYDFITKPFAMEAVAVALRRALSHRELRREVKRLRAAVSEPLLPGELLGKSHAMRALSVLLKRVAASDSTVMVMGESGTGKELVARALHGAGKRASGPFVAVNCAALPEHLLESELFGHVKGAFTDAHVAKKGLVAEASGGTLFLDEVGDIPIALQPKLLRAIEERCARPVGGTQEIPFDVRVIVATHRDLESAITDGTFREDLFYRLNVITIRLPPLRARGGDVLLLAQHFIERFAAQADKAVTGLSSAAAERLMRYTWPGNVRELRNCVERAVALTSYEAITVDDLPERIRDYKSRHIIVAGDDPTELVALEEVERRYILKVLEATAGNKSLAATTLGISRKTLYRKLAAYGVDAPED